MLKQAPSDSADTHDVEPSLTTQVFAKVCAFSFARQATCAAQALNSPSRGLVKSSGVPCLPNSLSPRDQSKNTSDIRTARIAPV